MNADNRKLKVALLSVVSNTHLVVLKLSVGLAIGAVSVISEAIHSGVDLVAAGIAWYSVRTSGIPADRVAKLIDAFKIAMNSDGVKNFSKKMLLPLVGTAGADADKFWELQTQVQSWLLYDIKDDGVFKLAGDGYGAANCCSSC